MRAQAVRFAIVAAALLALAFGTVVAGRSEPGSPAAARPLIDAPHDQLALVRGGVLTPLSSVERIEIAGDLTASVALRVESGVRYARVLSMELRAGSGVVDGATITIAAHMLAMDHGSFATTALPSGDGTYVARLPFVMPGEWQLDLHVMAAETSGDLTLDLNEFD